jgi:hypothetical protein
MHYTRDCDLVQALQHDSRTVIVTAQLKLQAMAHPVAPLASGWELVPGRAGERETVRRLGAGPLFRYLTFQNWYFRAN